MTTCYLLVLSSLHLLLTILLYADPGSGMLIWQLVTAAVFGLLFYAKTILRKVRLLLRSGEPEEGQERPVSGS